MRPHVAEISLKNRQNAKKIPILVTKILFPPFSVRRGPPTPKRGEVTFGTRICPHAKYGLNRPAGCGEIVDKKSEQTKNIQ